MGVSVGWMEETAVRINERVVNHDDFNQNCPMLIFAMVLLRNLLKPISLLEEIEGARIHPLPRSILPPILICLVVAGTLVIFSLLKTVPLAN